jgi:RNA polymerase sigma-70 factor (ECF subfamily)
MADSDEELMRRAGRGDLRAFGRLFDRHQPSLFAFLCRFLGDAATAEDVAQDVFWRVWEHRTMFDGSRRFTTWLYVIARRAALNEIKKPYRRAAPLSELSEELHERLETPDDAPLGSTMAIRDLYVREKVREALQGLPPDQRLCIVLREYEGRSHAEIADILGCSEGNARVLAHRARAALRVILQPLLEREGNCV